MKEIQYYWLEEKEDLQIIEKALLANHISYEIKIEKIKYRMKEEIHQKQKEVYLVFVDETQVDLVDRILLKQRGSQVKTSISKKIEYVKEGKKGNIKEIALSLLISLGILVFLLLPIGYFNNEIIVMMLQIIKIIVILGGTIYTARKNAYAILVLIMGESVGIFIISNLYFENNTLGILDVFNYSSKYYLFYLIILMIITVMYGAFYGLRNYENSTLKDKFSYCILLVVGYLSIMGTTIVGYAEMYANYHNEIYFRYAEKLVFERTSINPNSVRCIKETKEEIDSGYLLIEGYYDKELGSTETSRYPYRISIDEFNEQGEFVNSYVIEPGINSVLSDDFLETTSGYEYIYFSTITYLTIGYGDIYPIENIVKSWVMQESLIAHIMTILFVPMLIVLGQIFINKNEKMR